MRHLNRCLQRNMQSKLYIGNYHKEVGDDRVLQSNVVKTSQAEATYCGQEIYFWGVEGGGCEAKPHSYAEIPPAFSRSSDGLPITLYDSNSFFKFQALCVI